MQCPREKKKAAVRVPCREDIAAMQVNFITFIVEEKGIIILFCRMEKEQERINTRIKYLKKQINMLPEGKIRTARNGKYTKIFYVGARGTKLVSKKNVEYISEMVRKMYYSAELEDLLQEQNALEQYQQAMKKKKSAQEKYLSNPYIRKTLKQAFREDKQELLEWESADYDKNLNYPEQLRYSSPSGNMVRSKSEVFIDQTLFRYQIPYRYECRLVLGELTFYPDFTIMNPRTKEILYWEHFGMMDNPAYAQKAFQKLQTYNSYGIMPGHRLIVTYESRECPLDLQMIEQMIALYLT